MRDARIRIGVFLWRGCGCRMCSFLVASGCLDVVFRRSDRHRCFGFGSKFKSGAVVACAPQIGALHMKRVHLRSEPQTGSFLGDGQT